VNHRVNSMSSAWRFRTLIALISSLAMILAACSGTADTSTTAGDSGSDTSADTTAPDEGEGDETPTTSAESNGEVLSIAIGAEPGSMDPLLKSDGQRDAWSFSVLEGLTQRTNEIGVEGIAPLLAESWEVDGTAYIFHLREGVTFHDGSDFTADDVVASYTRMLQPGSELLNQFITDDTTVEKVDDYTVRIGRPVADPLIVSQASLIPIVPAEWADLDDNRLADAMVGTGPYRFDGWDKGQEIRLSRYDDYWGDKPQINEVVIRFLTEEATRLSALQAGEVQLARNMSPDNVGVAPKVVAGFVSEVLIVRLNAEHGPLTDVRVRQAINHAIDREAIIEEIYGGFAVPAQGQEVAQYVFGANPDLQDYEYDPDLAAQLIQEAGVQGETVVMSATTGHWAKDREVAQAIAGMIETAGLTVDLQFPEFSIWVEDLFVAAEDDTLASDLAPYNHSNELFDSSKTIGQNLECAGAASTYCNPEVDALARQALEETDPEARERLYHEAWELMWDDAAFAAVADVQQVHFTSENLIWEPPVDGFMRIQFMSFN
jgi:peptide/nickel transport system substrate-binding protein